MPERGNGTSASGAGHVHRKLISRHAEDAAFYWARRMEGSLVSQHDLRSLARFEFLLQANLEGLRVAQHESSTFTTDGAVLLSGSAGWDAAFGRVRLWKTADETFVAATLVLEEAGAGPTSANGAALAASPLLAQLEEMACDQFDDASASAVTPMARGLASAAGWLPWEVVGPSVQAWARSPEPVLRRNALSALALHRLPAGQALAQWLQDPHALVRERALRAVGELGRADLAAELVAALDEATPGDAWHCHAAAAWSLCLLGHRRGSEFDIGVAQALPGQEKRSLLAAWAQVAPAESLQAAVETALQQPEAWRMALVAMRFSGHVRWLDVLIQVMEHQCAAEPVARFFTEPASNLARLAADVFAHITGARIGDQLWTHAPEPDAAAEDLASDPRIPATRKQDPDDGLLWPDVDAVKRWWTAHRARFAAGGEHQGRYLAGLPLGAGSASQVLVDHSATQLQRQHAALFLRCTGHTAMLFDVRAALPTQRGQAAALGLVLP